MLVIIATHPIQYQVPLWQALARDGSVPFEVWYLTKHGVDASVDREFGQNFAWDLDMLSGYPHRFLKSLAGATPNSFWKCRTSENLVTCFRAANASVVWIQGWNVLGYWQAAFAAKQAGAQVWLRGESNDLAPRPLWKRLIRNVALRWLFSRVDHFLYIGSANRRLYQNFGISADRLHSAPYAVDNERFAKQANEIRNAKLEIRKQWKIPEDAFCVLFCGKFIPKKRPMDLIRAAKLLITNHSITNNRTLSVHLLFVGSGELGGELRENCNVVFDAEYNLTSDIRLPTSETKPAASFTGFLNQTAISKAYVAADCLVLPSDYGETWGLVVNEAMASGLPCFISDRCGCALDLGRHKPNQTYRFGNIGALSDCLATSPRKELTKAAPPSLEATETVVEALYTFSRS